MRKWTEEELRFVQEHYQTMTHAEIAQKLGRTEKAVRNLCYKRGWQKLRPWTPEEDALLKELYGKFQEHMFLDAVAKELGRSRAAVAHRAHELGLTRMDRPRAMEAVLKTIKAASRYARTRNGLGVLTAGGFREDLGIYVRSRWEANYARYLNWLKEQGKVKEWQYEPETFEFPHIKRGTRFYTPDFKVVWADGTVEYHEVKGYMDQKSRTALKRMARYYPDVKIVVIDRSTYQDIRRKLCRVIPGWEEPNGKLPSFWSEAEEAILKELWESGVPVAEIARRLGRSENAVALRAQRKGFRRPAARRKAG